MSHIVLVTASVAYEQRVRRALGDTFSGTLDRWQSDIMFVDALQATKELAAEAPDVIAIGPHVPVEVALELAKAVDEEHPEIGAILVAEPSMDLWEQALRAGVRDVLTPDADDDAVRVAFERVLETAMRRRHNLVAEDASSKARVITVVAPKGGAGKTAVTTNLAASLAGSGAGRVALVDLDLQFGDVANTLHLSPENTIAELARVPGGVTPTTLKVFLTARSENFYALCAPESPAEGEDVPEVVVERVLRILSEEFDYVVVDTSAGLDETTLAAIEMSTDLLFLCDLSVSSLRGLRKVIDALDQLGITTPQRHFVLNRADSKVGIDPEDAAALVGLPAAVEVPSSRHVPLTMNSGVPVVEESPRSPVGRAFTEISRLFADLEDERTGLFKFRSKA